jgi:transposase
MKYIQGQSRSQTCLFPISLDDSIEPENEVRVIDLFVDSLKLEGYGFKVSFVENGRPAYHPGDLLKLYIYGYINKVRSSRDLEKECKRNIEVMWLLNCLKPDHNTISNFRRIMNILGKERMKAYLEKASNTLFSILFEAIWSLIRLCILQQTFLRVIFIRPANRVYLIQNITDNGGF